MINPVLMIAPFYDDLSARTLNAFVNFTATGTPTFTGLWSVNVGSWGNQGVWGHWKPYGAILKQGVADQVELSIDDVLSPEQGSMVFTITPLSNSSTEEILGELGEKASSSDQIRWGKDGSQRLFVEWSSNNAPYQRITAITPSTVGDTSTVYIGWSSTDITMKSDYDVLQTGSRGTSSESFGTNMLTLYSGSDGNIVGLLAAYLRTLTEYEYTKYQDEAEDTDNLWNLFEQRFSMFRQSKPTRTLSVIKE